MCDDFFDGPICIDNLYDERDIEPNECVLNDEDYGYSGNDNGDLQNEPEKLLKNIDALIFGSMVFGNAYDDILRSRRLNEKEKLIKD